MGWFCPWVVFNVTFLAGRNRVKSEVILILLYLRHDFENWMEASKEDKDILGRWKKSHCVEILDPGFWLPLPFVIKFSTERDQKLPFSDL